jgi:hypothetical protein
MREYPVALYGVSLIDYYCPEICAAMSFGIEACDRVTSQGNTLRRCSPASCNEASYKIRKIDASKIQGDAEVRVVFFKMALTTGWDPSETIRIEMYPTPERKFSSEPPEKAGHLLAKRFTAHARARVRTFQRNSTFPVWSAHTHVRQSSYYPCTGRMPEGLTAHVRRLIKPRKTNSC